MKKSYMSRGKTMCKKIPEIIDHVITSESISGWQKFSKWKRMCYHVIGHQWSNRPFSKYTIDPGTRYKSPFVNTWPSPA